MYFDLFYPRSAYEFVPFSIFFIKVIWPVAAFLAALVYCHHQLVKNSDTEIQMMLVIQCDNDRLDQDPLNL